MKRISRSITGVLSRFTLVVMAVVMTVSLPAAAIEGPYRIRTTDTKRCMDVRDVSHTNGALIQLYDCLDYQYNQQWNLYPVATAGGTAFQLRPGHDSSKCLDVRDWAMGAGQLQIWDCLGSSQTNQLFLTRYSSGAMKYQAVHSGKCITYGLGAGNMSLVTQSDLSCDASWPAWYNWPWNKPIWPCCNL